MKILNLTITDNEDTRDEGLVIVPLGLVTIAKQLYTENTKYALMTQHAKFEITKEQFDRIYDFYLNDVLLELSVKVQFED